MKNSPKEAHRKTKLFEGKLSSISKRVFCVEIFEILSPGAARRRSTEGKSPGAARRKSTEGKSPGAAERKIIGVA
mgnify:CR=1 FL=1